MLTNNVLILCTCADDREYTQLNIADIYIYIVGVLSDVKLLHSTNNVSIGTNAV